MPLNINKDPRTRLLRKGPLRVAVLAQSYQVQILRTRTGRTELSSQSLSRPPRVVAGSLRLLLLEPPH